MSFRMLGFKRWSKNNVPIMTHFSPLAVDSSTSLHTFMSEPRNRNFNNIWWQPYSGLAKSSVVNTIKTLVIYLIMCYSTKTFYPKFVLAYVAKVLKALH